MAAASSDVSRNDDFTAAALLECKETRQTICALMNANSDPAHACDHSYDVAHLAAHLAKTERLSSKKVALAALVGLCHDLWDHKLENATEREALVFSGFLVPQYGVATATQVRELANLVSWSHERAWNDTHNEPIEAAASDSDVLRCVQDADRLQAVGAIGLARCFSYGGYLGRPLQETIRVVEQRSFALPFKTAEGQRIARCRVDFTRRFLDEFQNEQCER